MNITRMFYFSLFAIAVSAVLGFQLGWLIGIGFSLGALSSAIAGFAAFRVLAGLNLRPPRDPVKFLGRGVRIVVATAATHAALIFNSAALAMFAYYSVLTRLVGLEPVSPEVSDGVVAVGFSALLFAVFALLGWGAFSDRPGPHGWWWRHLGD